MIVLDVQNNELAWLNATGVRKVGWFRLEEADFREQSGFVLMTPDFDFSTGFIQIRSYRSVDNHAQMNPTSENCQKLKMIIFQVWIEASICKFFDAFYYSSKTLNYILTHFLMILVLRVFKLLTL